MMRGRPPATGSKGQVRPAVPSWNGGGRIRELDDRVLVSKSLKVSVSPLPDTHSDTPCRLIAPCQSCFQRVGPRMWLATGTGSV